VDTPRYLAASKKFPNCRGRSSHNPTIAQEGP
jgi:hypothetical protein